MALGGFAPCGSCWLLLPSWIPIAAIVDVLSGSERLLHPSSEFPDSDLVDSLVWLGCSSQRRVGIGVIPVLSRFNDLAIGNAGYIRAAVPVA